MIRLQQSLYSSHLMRRPHVLLARSLHVFDFCIRSSAALHRLQRLAVFWSSLKPRLLANGPTAGDPDHNHSVEEETGTDLSHVRAVYLTSVLAFVAVSSSS
eukprot:1491062-Pleurochrysis_carterae.AAC.2